MNTLEGLREGKITGDVIQLFYRVYDRLGFGYAESVYINALVIELKAAGIPFEREKAVDVWQGRARRCIPRRTARVIERTMCNQ